MSPAKGPWACRIKVVVVEAYDSDPIYLWEIDCVFFMSVAVSRGASRRDESIPLKLFRKPLRE
jgi:hypothetical protein